MSQSEIDDARSATPAVHSPGEPLEAEARLPWASIDPESPLEATNAAAPPLSPADASSAGEGAGGALPPRFTSTENDSVPVDERLVDRAFLPSEEEPVRTDAPHPAEAAELAATEAAHAEAAMAPVLAQALSAATEVLQSHAENAAAPADAAPVSMASSQPTAPHAADVEIVQASSSAPAPNLAEAQGTDAAPTPWEAIGETDFDPVVSDVTDRIVGPAVRPIRTAHAVDTDEEAMVPAIGEASPEGDSYARTEISVVAAEEAAATFAISDPFVSTLSEVATTAEAVQATEEYTSWAVPAAQLAPAPEAQTLTAPALELDEEDALALEPAPTGSGWTIPLLSLGLGLIACCIVIPQADTNRRLFYQQQMLQADLEQVQKQLAVNDEFLQKVSSDPALAERLAARQMKQIRKGQKVLSIRQSPSDSDMSPFALVTVAAPPVPPAYKPVGGTIANLCYDARSRLYLMGAAMTMVAAGLVLGFGAKRAA